MDLEINGRGLIEALYLHFPGRTESIRYFIQSPPDETLRQSVRCLDRVDSDVIRALI